MKLSLITINFKKPALTLACLASLYNVYADQFEKGAYELVIVDNFSQDDSVALLEKEIHKKKYKHVRVLAHKVNNGFGGGNNFGAHVAKGEYILFINNDTIVESGLTEMLLFAQESGAGIVGGVLQNTSGTVQHSYDSFYDIPHVLLLLLGLQRFSQSVLHSPQQVDWVKGACLLIRKDLFEMIHGFDEGIFMYTEDMELCFRMHKLGKSVWAFPNVKIYHTDQGSSNRTFAIVHIYQGILYFYKKHRPAWEYAVVKLLLQSKAALLVLLGKVLRNQYLLATYEKAFNVAR